MQPIFRDRRDAGRSLAAHLRDFARDDAVVLALPRGGVPVAFEVARALDLPLDVFVVRKLGVPGQEELAMGAIASGGVRVLNDDVIRSLGIPPQAIAAAEARELRVLKEREALYRGQRPPTRIEGRTVIVIDDGLATGSSMKAAVVALRASRPARIVVAVPLAPGDTVAELAAMADDVICVAMPEPFWGVGRWYLSFPQTSDEEVTELLAEGREAPAEASS